MPLYEYRCTQCGHRFEKIEKFNSEPETACPKCGGVLQRPLTAPALQFKGAGWYVNDYGAKAGPSTSESSSASAPAEAKAPAASGEGASSSPPPAAAPASS